MEISYIETKTPLESQTDAQKAGEALDNRLLIVVDRETEITIDGYGSQLYRLRLRNVSRDPGSEYDPEGCITNFKPTCDFWGHGLVWATPRTIAHLVMDVINEQ